MHPLPPYTAARLGPAQAAEAQALRDRLRDAGIVVPPWIDAHPGRLQAVIGDCAGDPPLSGTERTLALWHAETLLLGLGALGLMAGGARLWLVARDEALCQELTRRGRAAEAVTVQKVSASWPSQPDLEIPGAAGRAWVVPARVLDRAGTALRGEPPHRLITVAGMVRRPQVVPLAPGPVTVADLIRLCGGAKTPAWTAVGGWPPRLLDIDADEPLPADETLLMVLPTGHPLIRRLRDAAPVATTMGCASCALCTDACPVALRGPQNAELQPHRVVDAWARAGSLAGALAAANLARGCTGCGACDAVCPQDLLPGLWTGRLASATPTAAAGAADPRAALRRVPITLVTQRYGLAAYDQIT